MEVELYSPRNRSELVIELHSSRNPSSSSTATAKELRALPPPSPTKREHSPTLISHMKKNKVTGKGAQMLEKMEYMLDDDAKDEND